MWEAEKGLAREVATLAKRLRNRGLKVRTTGSEWNRRKGVDMLLVDRAAVREVLTAQGFRLVRKETPTEDPREREFWAKENLTARLFEWESPKTPPYTGIDLFLPDPNETES